MGIGRHRYVYPHHWVFPQSELRQGVGTGEALVDDIFLFSIVFGCFFVVYPRSSDLEKCCDEPVSGYPESLLVPYLLRAALCGFAVSGGRRAGIEPTAT